MNIEKTDQTFLALIPAYEPEPVLLEIITELETNGLDVVVVDDGSGDTWAAFFTEIEKSTYAVVLHHKRNLGKGSGIKTGLNYIADYYEKPYTVVCVDADGQHKVSDVMKVLHCASENRETLVLGSRKLSGEVPLKSRFGNTVTRAVYRLLSGTYIYDTQTGLRAFSDTLVPLLKKVKGERYEYEMNVLMKFAREKIPIQEIWIETIYLEGNSSSHFHAVKDSLRIYKEILKFSASSLIGFMTDYVMYCLLLAVTGNLVASNIIARFISASVNYTLNRKLVFKCTDAFLNSAARYAVLAGGILAGNTFLLKLLTQFGWNGYIAKILVEILFFLFSWTIQRNIVFSRR